jgi:hypothetical protein
MAGLTAEFVKHRSTLGGIAFRHGKNPPLRMMHLDFCGIDAGKKGKEEKKHKPETKLSSRHDNAPLI